MAMFPPLQGGDIASHPLFAGASSSAATRAPKRSTSLGGAGLSSNPYDGPRKTRRGSATGHSHSSLPPLLPVLGVGTFRDMGSGSALSRRKHDLHSSDWDIAAGMSNLMHEPSKYSFPTRMPPRSSSLPLQHGRRLSVGGGSDPGYSSRDLWRGAKQYSSYQLPKDSLFRRHSTSAHSSELLPALTSTRRLSNDLTHPSSGSLNRLADVTLPKDEAVSNLLELRRNRLEFIAEMFIIILTTSTDYLEIETIKMASRKARPNAQNANKDSGGNANANQGKSGAAQGKGHARAPSRDMGILDGILYTFKTTHIPLSSYPHDASLESPLNRFLRPRAADTTSSGGDYSRLWRATVASLRLKSAGLFEDAQMSFEVIAKCLQDLVTCQTKGIPMTAFGSKMCLYDILCSHTEAGTAAWPPDRIDYLRGMSDYAARLVLYMVQVVTYFLIPEQPDPLSVLEAPLNQSALRGAFETPSHDISGFGHHNSRMVADARTQWMEEKEVADNVRKTVQKGRVRPDLADLEAETFELPVPLARKVKWVSQAKTANI